ncbi:MAG: (d)CMP kinase, partial [Gammaproteobacteria bacterium]|nr:(d)CMP kinase [Gammaproteobacteria bacterium]
MPDHVPVITVDGPSGSGKGTVTQRVANRLDWRVLDSGALYRLVGHAVDQAGIEFENKNKISQIASTLNVKFDGGRI